MWRLTKCGGPKVMIYPLNMKNDANSDNLPSQWFMPILIKYLLFVLSAPIPTLGLLTRGHIVPQLSEDYLASLGSIFGDFHSFWSFFFFWSFGICRHFYHWSFGICSQFGTSIAIFSNFSNFDIDINYRFPGLLHTTSPSQWDPNPSALSKHLLNSCW